MICYLEIHHHFHQAIQIRVTFEHHTARLLPMRAFLARLGLDLRLEMAPERLAVRIFAIHEHVAVVVCEVVADLAVGRIAAHEHDLVTYATERLSAAMKSKRLART